MTEPKVLADALVDSGIGCKYTETNQTYPYYFYPDMNHNGFIAQVFITDWRVAGKCLEWCKEKGYTFGFACVGRNQVEAEICKYNGLAREHDIIGSAVCDSLPRAIVEVWYTAQANKQ